LAGWDHGQGQQQCIVGRDSETPEPTGHRYVQHVDFEDSISPFEAALFGFECERTIAETCEPAPQWTLTLRGQIRDRAFQNKA
jgi:hypothetical protein